MERLTYAIEHHEHGVIFTIEGEIDHSNSHTLGDLLLRWIDKGRHVGVHLGKVDYLDSSGIACLLNALQRAQSRAQRFGLVATSEPVRRVLELARIDSLLPGYDSDQGHADSSASPLSG